MDERTRRALIAIAADAPEGMRQELTQFIQTGGTAPLSLQTRSYAETMLRAQGMSIMPGTNQGGGVSAPNERQLASAQEQSVPNAAAGGMRPDATITSSGSAPNPQGGTPQQIQANAVDEFGRPTTDNYAEQVAQAQAAVRAKAAATGTQAGGALSAPTGATPAAGSAPVPGGFNAEQAIGISTDDDLLMQLAAQAMGIDVTRPGLLGAKILKFLAPMLQARRNLYGLNAGTEGDIGGLPQDIVNFAQDFTKPGVNAFANARQYAQGVMGGGGVLEYLNRLGDTAKQQQFLASLQPLLYGGANPLVQQAVSDETGRQQAKYGWQEFQGYNPASGVQKPPTIYSQFIEQQQDPFIKKLFGMR